jgi:hypothetical protein
MEEKKEVFQNVTAADYANLLGDLAAEDLAIKTTSVDSFEAPVSTLKGFYNRNQQTLTLTLSLSEWQAGLATRFQEEMERVTDKGAVTGEVQSIPVMTPIDRQTGKPVTMKFAATEPEKVTPETPAKAEPVPPPAATSAQITPSPAVTGTFTVTPAESAEKSGPVPATPTKDNPPPPVEDAQGTKPTTVAPPVVKPTPVP